jgi:hypothetical protein
LGEALQIMILLPYWLDLLEFSGGGLLSEMRRAAPVLEKEYLASDSELDMKRSYVLSSLGLDQLDDPIALLHENVQKYSGKFIVLANDGFRYEPLFNTFVVEDNPYWKGA